MNNNTQEEKKHLVVLPLIIGLILGLFVIGCITEKKRAKICATCPATNIETIKEVEKITPFDTTLFLSGYQGKEIFLPSKCGDLCDSLEALMIRYNNNYTNNNDGVITSITKDKDGYKFRSIIDSLKVQISLLKKETIKEHNTSKERILTVEKSIPVPCNKPHVNWLYRFALVYLIISVVALALYIIKTIRGK